jgi:sulfur relay protein TusB/DsrH
MKRICLLITKPPHTDDGQERMCGIAKRAREREMEVAVYLIGDGVYCAKKGQKGHMGESIRMALQNGVKVRASAKDLKARALPEDRIEEGVEFVEELESDFVKDMMENAERVISW